MSTSNRNSTSAGWLTVFPVGANPQSIATGDLNADGTLDLTVAHNGINGMATLLGNGDGTFATPIRVPRIR